MTAARGKRRSRSQRLGEVGESVFKTWALENGLIPQKVEHDYGVDFFAQVSTPISRGAEEVTGAVLAAQVRSVGGGARPRVRVDRADVENALRVDVPFCFFAVDIKRKEVRHLFVDEELVRRFREFLKRPEGITSIRMDEFGFGTHDFRRSLARVSRSGYRERLRILKTELKLAGAMPGSRLTLSHTSGAGLAVLELPWITQALDISSGSRDALAALVFEEGRLPYPGEEGAHLRRELGLIYELVEGPVVLSGAFESTVEIAVTANGSTLTQPFVLRRLDDERAYVEPSSGLALVVSDARRQQGGYFHEMGVRLARASAQPIDSLPSKEFLRRLRPGATLNEASRPGIPIAHWPNLERIGPAIDAIDLVRERLGLETSRIILADLKDKEFGMTLTLLDLMLTGVGLEHIAPGFVLGPAAAQPPDANQWLPAGFRVPVVANFKNNGLVVWVEGTGDLYIGDGLICGFRMRQQSRWECDVRDARFEKGANPEVLVTRDWPAIPLFCEPPSGQMTFTGNIEHPVGGDIWPLVTEPSEEADS